MNGNTMDRPASFMMMPSPIRPADARKSRNPFEDPFRDFNGAWDEYHRYMQRATDVYNPEREDELNAWRDYHRYLQRSKVYAPTDYDLARQAFRENQKYFKRATDVYQPEDDDPAAAWREYHRYMNRSQVYAPTEDDLERQAWKEYHKYMKRSVVPLPSEDDEARKAWDEYHKYMDRSKIPTDQSEKAKDVAAFTFRSPQVHVVPRKDTFLVVADVPGCRKEDLKVTIEDDDRGRRFLVVSGERKAEEEQKDERSHVHRWLYGRFARSMRLPENADARSEKLKVKYENGSLKVTLPLLQASSGGTTTGKELRIE